MKRVGLLVVAFGLLMHAYAAFVFKTSGSGWGFSLGLLAWSSLPYLVCAALLFLVRRPLIPIVGMVGPITMDLMTYYSVFISPQSSLEGLRLLWQPLWNLVLWMPAGFVVGWAVAKGQARP